MSGAGPIAERDAEIPPPPSQTETGWRKTLDQIMARVLANTIVHTTLRVMDAANQSGAPLFAAALAFTTLFAVVPLFLLLAGLLGWVIEDAVQRSTLLDQLVSYFPPLAESMSTSLENVVRERGTLSIVGLVGLLWGASSYYAVLDEVMRRIFASEHARGFVDQRLRGIITVLVLVGLMVGTIALSGAFALLSDQLGAAGQLLRLLFPMAALSVMVVVVLALYLLVPGVPPSWRAALPPAIAAGVGIGILTNVFSLLTPWLIGGLLAFGVIATVFGALIWLSLSYQILLYGAAWARIRRDAEVRRGVAATAEPLYAD